jgi:pyrroline-5-carboxylate reductase
VRVGIIGGGVMGEAILGAAVDREVFDPQDVTVCEKIEHRRDQLRAEYGVAVTGDSVDCMREADLVILSVKPQELGTIHGALKPDALLLSIMAGIHISTIATAFQHDRVVRVMPNTPVAAKAGMSVWTATPAVDGVQRELTHRLLGSIGRDLYVEDESKVDMATALSGSGPAYVFLFIEAMIDGGVSIGLTRAQAQEMALQTVLGSALYAQESNTSPSELRARVTSPAGTTAAGLLEMERGALRATIVDGIRAAYERAVELGGPQ